MDNFYSWLKLAHVSLVVLSVGGFTARGVAVLSGAVWPRRPDVRRATVLVDSLLLACGLGLWWHFQWAPMAWLFVKFCWLLAYIVLGSLALKRARTRRGQALCFCLALLCVAQLVATALR